jgi:4'-phosphopantetheinyl transferase
MTEAVASDELALVHVPADYIVVWSWDLDEPVDTAVLSPEERVRADRFVFVPDRRRWAASRALLRHTLGRVLDRDPGGLAFVSGPGGKPHLADDDLCFSLSRSARRGLLAVTQCGPVGADIEILRPFPDALEVARRFFAPGEANAIARLPVDEQTLAFLKLWVCKEAIVKASGGGITGPLDAFAVELADETVTVRVLAPDAPPMPEAVRLLPLPDAVAAVAGPAVPVSWPSR